MDLRMLQREREVAGAPTAKGGGYVVRVFGLKTPKTLN